MIVGGWRRTGALVAHEAGVASSRPRAWIARWLLAAGSSAMLLVFATSVEETTRRDELAASLRAAAGALWLAVYLALLFLVPWIMRGALEKGGRRATLDLLAASPLTDFQVFAALLGGRLLSVTHLLLGLAPAVMVFAWLGGGGAIANGIQVLGIALVAAWVTVSYACFNAFLGLGEGLVWTRLVLFLMVTPLGVPYGFRACLLGLPIFLLLAALVGLDLAGKILSVLFCAFFPFWTIGFSILEGPLFGPRQAAALAACLILGLVLSSDVARRFPRWLRDREEGPEREVSSYSLRWRRHPPPAREAPPSWEGALGSYRRRRLSGMSWWVRALYRLSGRSPYVVREILRDDFRGEALGAALFVLFILAWLSDLTFRADPRGPMPGATAAVFAIVPCAFLAILEASRAVPSKGTAALHVFLSTPLTGGRIFAGSLLAAYLRFRYALLAVLGMGLTVRDGLDFARGPAFVFLFAAILALAHGIGLWARFLGPSRRLGAALGVTACLGVALVTAWLWPEGGLPHPLRAWQSAQVWYIFASGTLVALLAALLWTRFSAAFRTLAARGA